MKNTLTYCVVSSMMVIGMTNAFAFFCPRNFQLIQVGDSINTVRQKCGNPDQETTQQEQEPIPQEWSYFITQSVSTTGNDTAPGSVKVTMVFDTQGRAINLNVNGIGVGASNICGGAIQLGDTMAMIKAHCGTPTFIFTSTSQGAAQQPPAHTITLFTYHSTPTVTLRFKDGLLTGKQ